MSKLPAYQRSELETLVSRLNEEPHSLICITGPRQCGKTTLILQGLQLMERHSQYVPVDEPESIIPATFFGDGSRAFPAGGFKIESGKPRSSQWLVRIWERARAEANQSERGFILVLDEIHYIPGWHITVKGLWDADRRRGIPLHVVLLGSAPLLMQAGLTDALTGRFELIQLSHWSLAEMAEVFNVTLNEFIFFGGYPGAIAFRGNEQRWRSYVLNALIEPTLERDVLALERVDKPALLRQLVEVGANSSGKILSYTKLLGQLQDAGNTTTLARYLGLLSKVGLMRGLDKYANNVVRRRASIPKFQVLNTAVQSVHSDYTFNQAQADRSHWGRLVESAVGAHLCNTATAGMEVHYWREGNLEVDFVVRYGRKVVGIEVKSGKKIGRLRGLEEFGRRFGATRIITVGRGGTELDEFLQTPAHQFFGDL